MQPGLESELKQFVPCRMKFDLIEAVTITIKRTQLWREFVGIKTELDRFRLAERRAERAQLVLGPTGRFTPDGFAKRAIARKQIVGFERRRLVLDLEYLS